LDYNQYEDKNFCACTGLAIIATGCFSTVTDTKKAGMPLVQDQVEGRYPRSMDQVYQAAVHSSKTMERSSRNSFRTTPPMSCARCRQSERVQRLVARRSGGSRYHAVVVQARTKWGNSDIELAHQVEKEIALQLVR